MVGCDRDPDQSAPEYLLRNQADLLSSMHSSCPGRIAIKKSHPDNLRDGSEAVLSSNPLLYAWIRSNLGPLILLPFYHFLPKLPKWLDSS